MLQDHSGRLWVCTEFGLYRFDGSRFDLVQTVEDSNLPFVQSIAEDSLGRIWATTPQSVVYRDAAGLHNIAPLEQDLGIDLRTPIVVLPNDPNRVFFISRHLLMDAHTVNGGQTWQIGPAFSADDLARHPQLAKIKGAYVNPDGSMWLGCGDQICETAKDLFKVWGNAEGVPADQWRTMLHDRQGNFWARGNHHFIRLRPRTSRFVSEDNDLPRSALELRSPMIVEDPQDRILLNTNNGIVRWERGAWSSFTRQNGLSAGAIQTMLFDRQGSLWFDGGKAGLQRWIGYDGWESWTTDDGLRNGTIWAVLRDEGHDIWLGTESGLERMKNGPRGLQPQTADLKLHLRRVQAVTKTADRHLWLGSDDGSVVEYNPDSGVSNVIANERNIYQIFVDHDDRIWILSDNGLFFANPESGHHTIQRPPGNAVPQTRFFRAVQEPSGAILFTSDQGIFRFDGNRWIHIKLPAFYRPCHNAQIALGKDNSFWISGTSPSLLQFRLNNSEVIVLDQVSVPTLASGNIYLLNSDLRGWIWAGTDTGLDVYNGAEWRHISQEDGLIWNDIDTAAFLSEADGSVWIGTSAGLSHFLHPERLFLDEPLEVWLTEAMLGKVALAQNTVQQFQWGHYPLTFHLSASDFARGHAITFRYRLDGVDDNWQETNSHDLRYSIVPEGKHRLTVMAVDTSSHRLSPPQTIEFMIQPPWWRTPHFFIALVFGFALLVTAVWRWSNRFVIERQHELTKLVQERTVELERKNASLVDARSALVLQATHDSLTGLLNRGAIYAALETEMKRARREHSALVAVMADIDHFKRINDLYGHQCGDQVLTELAHRLHSSIRTYDSIGRYGGEEFLIILTKIGHDEALERIQLIRQAVAAQPVIFKECALHITCSFGAAWLDRESDLDMLIQVADQALYLAKANGRNRVEMALCSHIEPEAESSV
jgi:diguanylate cyclase (GGDEF)-like protein